MKELDNDQLELTRSATARLRSPRTSIGCMSEEERMECRLD